MSAFDRPWSLCGGWAIDAWIGHQTRNHGDIDISIFADHQQALRTYLDGWQLVAHDANVAGDTGEAWNGRRLDPPAHIHAHPPGPDEMPERLNAASQQGFIFEFQIDDGVDGGWVLNRDPRVTLPVKDAVRVSPWGVPAAVPEVLLFFKAGETRRRDHEDFLRILRHLSRQQSAWLADAIAAVHPGHGWLTQLSG
jgi:hypothetical protein